MEITNELLAAYAEGNVSNDERMAVRDHLMHNPDSMQTVMLMMDKAYCHMEDDDGQNLYSGDCLINRIDALYDEIMSDPAVAPSCKTIPATAMAADNIIDNRCAVRCEGMALRKLGISVTDDELFEESKAEGWLKPQGTPLHLVGRLAAQHGMAVAHRYDCTTEDIRQALEKGSVVIAAVDRGELSDDWEAKKLEDTEKGEIPDHVVVVESLAEDTVTLSDSSTPQHFDTYTLEKFIDAWQYSSCCIIIIDKGEDYEPHPIDLSDVEIEDELTELREAIAENAHEVWAYNRKKEGWRYGPKRNDEKKLHPDMTAYSQLPDSERQYDRDMAVNTIKLVKKLGWDIVKKKH